ncbi:amidohydrolase 2 [Aspergillus oryzae]|uniref:Amidohydrolase 2 n=1 Tax=Aspergillus oryzae TaxID=5062 RepID=A0A1S9DAA7_ASPOZ|nr:amidohydrolase 2 [Aspergillus oryzae]
MHPQGDTLNQDVVIAAANHIIEFAPLVPQISLLVVVYHIGAPDQARGPGSLQPGYAEFMDLLRIGHVWAELSGTYRFPDLPDLNENVTDILPTAPDRAVWGSDWPHSGGVEANPGGDCNKWYRDVEGGTGQQLAHKIWVENSKELWQWDNGG